MIFLLTYDRSAGVAVERTYPDVEIEKANGERLAIEIKYAKRSDIEVVILQSASLDELHKTHSRYFKSLEQLRRTG